MGNAVWQMFVMSMGLGIGVITGVAVFTTIDRWFESKRAQRALKGHGGSSEPEVLFGEAIGKSCGEWAADEIKAAQH